ncbi:MAG TPA: ABC transporter ATP-binding protein [Bacteroidota bacterium]|nr:ABC transporter ATP-binding protein [Bacteroidota bacterium]
MNKNVILKAIGISKVFNIGKKSELKVLKNIDLEIYSGDINLILGASGVGKSTLLHILGGLDRPTSGTVIFEDKNIFEFNDEELANFRNTKIGFVFQFHHLLNEFTALENICLPGLINRKNKKEVFEKARYLLNEIGLSDRADHKPNELSGGEQQRLAVARALINSPKIVFADEPTGNLDMENSKLLHQLIVKLNRDFNQTFLIVTHNQDLTQYANNIFKIKDGIIIKES